jgi:quercetin dioxygenase-like cupin family protein
MHGSTGKMVPQPCGESASLPPLTGDASIRGNDMLTRRRFGGCAICAAVGLVASRVDAQQPTPMTGITRTVLQKSEFPGEKYATILMTVDIKPDTAIRRHTHPGLESTYVLDGELNLEVKGQEARIHKAGDSFQIPAETPHGGRTGQGPVKLSVTYVVEKDKPLVTLVPE